MMFNKNMKAMVRLPDSDTEFFDIVIPTEADDIPQKLWQTQNTQMI